MALLATGSARSYDGEAVSELAHALQCAALAAADRADDELVLAALVHDVGRIPGVHDGPHEDVELPGLPERTQWLVRHHVAAKRWLVATEPYPISDVSRASLARQGGPADPTQVREWAAQEWWSDAVRLRRWDDAAKVAGLDVPGLDAYAHLL
jgi:predicted HD phosphohydrolase